MGTSSRLLESGAGLERTLVEVHTAGGPMGTAAHTTPPGAGASYEMTDGTHTELIDPADVGDSFEVFEVTVSAAPAAPPHASPWHGVLVVLEGEVTVHANGTAHALAPGAAITLPADVPYTYQVTTQEARFLAVTSGTEAGRFFADFAASVPTDRPVPEILPQLIAVTARHGVRLVERAQ